MGMKLAWPIPAIGTYKKNFFCYNERKREKIIITS